MRVFGSSLGAWKSLESIECREKEHGLTFSLVVLRELGAPWKLEMAAEEFVRDPLGFDAVFISVLDSRLMMNTAAHFKMWKVPLRRAERGFSYPAIFAGGQGLHNPMPYYEIADVIVVGDAEEPLSALLDAWETHGWTPGFLSAASTIPGVLVPAHHHSSETTIEQSVATDIGITLRSHVSVGFDKARRIEIARNCRHKCLFCGLGWRAPMRENPVADIVHAIETGPKRMHLQAGDAESHSGIDEIRAALQRRGIRDGGWTGRLDTTEREATIPSTKRYALGVEAMTWPVRRSVGKGYLTDERLLNGTCDLLDRIEGEGVGRLSWHMITGLPGEKMREDSTHFLALLEELIRRRRFKTPRCLTIGWQPFQPIPGTPMQWSECGRDAQLMAATMEGIERQPGLYIRHTIGRTNEVSRICCVLARSGAKGGVDLLEALGGDKPILACDAREIAGVGWGNLDMSAPLPWDWIRHVYPREMLERIFAGRVAA